MTTSPFGPAYKESTGTGDSYVPGSQVIVTQVYTPGSGDDNSGGKTEYIYQMCLLDMGNNGFQYTLERNISAKVVKLGGVDACGTKKTSNSSSTPSTTTAAG